MKPRVQAWLALAPLLALCVGGARAQEPARRPPVPPDTAAADTTRPPEAPDSVLQRLLELQGYTPIEYRGETAEYRTEEGTLRLRGSAEVVRQGERLSADSILYREPTGIVEAYGNPQVSGQGQDLEGDVLLYDLERRRASVRGGRTEFNQGGTWFVHGNAVAEDQGRRLYVTGASFTTCELEEPHYHFESDRVLFLSDNIIVARPARLHFGNVPVLWLPFIFQNLEEGRRSGILTPRFGINDIVRNNSAGDRAGTGRQISNVGYYWAISDYLGAELSGEWRSGEYTALTGALQYRWTRQFLNGDFNYSQFFPEDGPRRLTLSTSTRWRPTERTNVSVVGRYASSAEFVREQSIDPREATQDLLSTLALDHRFDWGGVSIGGERRQSIANGRVETQLPSIGITPRPITLFRSLAEEPRWYNNGTFTWGLTGSRATTEFKDTLPATLDEEAIQLAANQGLRFGNLGWNNSASFNRNLQNDVVIAADSFPNIGRDLGRLSSSLSYQQTLIGSTSITPNLTLNQELLRDDTLTSGEYAAAPVRLSFGAGLNTDLYGFFPGIGPYGAIRHNLRPTVSYSYAPEVEQTAEQERIFGQRVGSTQNIVRIGLSQTFEAKLRSPEIERPDTATADTAGSATLPTAPVDPQKVTLLSINTSSLEYDFAKAAAGESGFRTQEITNSVTSDYLGGLRVEISHDLFDEPREVNAENRGEFGDFSPFLSRINTGFDLGPESALFRLLGFGRRTEDSLVESPGVIPGTPPDLLPNPQGTGPATNNPQRTGQGPWRASIQYSYLRSRPDPNADEAANSALRRGEGQNLQGNIAFYPTANWAVSWNTRYSITDHEFGDHALRLTRDLHDWRANFNFYRTATGNTAFEMYVELIALPELKAEYRERNIGGNR